MRIGILSWHLFRSKGGAERFCVTLARIMRQRGHECILFYQGNKLGSSAYPLPEGVPAYDLALADEASLERARRIIHEAKLDVLCCRTATALALWLPALLKESGIPLLLSESTSPHAVENLFWNREQRLACMAAADGIHLLSQNYLSSLPGFLQKRATVVPNPASAPAAIDSEKENASRKKVLAVARLAEVQKQLSVLIRAFESLANDFPEWDCFICGAGFSHASYTHMIADMRLEHRIKLVGVVDDVGSYLKAAHIFCLPSAFEGYPNALLEAQSYGLPSVGFASCSGVNEIIVDGENGILAQNMTADSLAAALRPLMESADMRRDMGKRAHELLHRYDKKAVFDQWEAMLNSVAEAKNQTRLDSAEPVEDEEIERTLRESINSPRPLYPAPVKQKYTSILAQIRTMHLSQVGMKK